MIFHLKQIILLIHMYLVNIIQKINNLRINRHGNDDGCFTLRHANLSVNSNPENNNNYQIMGCRNGQIRNRGNKITLDGVGSSPNINFEGISKGSGPLDGNGEMLSKAMCELGVREGEMALINCQGYHGLDSVYRMLELPILTGLSFEKTINSNYMYGSRIGLEAVLSWFRYRLPRSDDQLTLHMQYYRQNIGWGKKVSECKIQRDYSETDNNIINPYEPLA